MAPQSLPSRLQSQMPLLPPPPTLRHTRHRIRRHRIRPLLLPLLPINQLNDEKSFRLQFKKMAHPPTYVFFLLLFHIRLGSRKHLSLGFWSFKLHSKHHSFNLLQCRCPRPHRPFHHPFLLLLSSWTLLLEAPRVLGRGSGNLVPRGSFWIEAERLDS